MGSCFPFEESNLQSWQQPRLSEDPLVNNSIRYNQPWHWKLPVGLLFLTKLRLQCFKKLFTQCQETVFPHIFLWALLGLLFGTVICSLLRSYSTDGGAIVCSWTQGKPLFLHKLLHLWYFVCFFHAPVRTESSGAENLSSACKWNKVCSVVKIHECEWVITL